MKNNKSANVNSFHDGTTYKLWMLCACGCETLVRNVFAQGHDMKYMSQLVVAEQESLNNA